MSGDILLRVNRFNPEPIHQIVKEHFNKFSSDQIWVDCHLNFFYTNQGVDCHFGQPMTYPCFTIFISDYSHKLLGKLLFIQNKVVSIKWWHFFFKNLKLHLHSFGRWAIASSLILSFWPPSRSRCIFTKKRKKRKNKKLHLYLNLELSHVALSHALPLSPMFFWAIHPIQWTSEWQSLQICNHSLP